METRIRSESWSRHAIGIFKPREIPILFHLLMAASMVTMLTASRYWFEYYSLISQEDHEVEWASVVIYLAAALVGLIYAIPRRRLFDGAVALFCLFNGGEEFSWGQRLLGFSPPKYFLESNIQQEVSLHNFFGPSAHDLFFGTMVLGYFLLLPLLARFAHGRKLMAKLGASAPPSTLAPWAMLLIAIYVTYPFHLVSEWIESIVAGLFLAAAAFLGSRTLTSKRIIMGILLVFVATLILTRISNAQERVGTPERVACAQKEVRSLLYDMLHGGATAEKLFSLTVATHRRIYGAGNRGYLKSSAFAEFNSTRCTGSASENEELRHRYAIDPWGLSYWIFVVPLKDGSLNLTVYSFGPDRRRDSDAGTPGNTNYRDDDDISVSALLLNKNAPPSKDETLNPIFSVEP